MTNEPEKRESTYIVDAESAVELARLMKQDRLTTRYMGGVFPDGPKLSHMHNILDVACGPGGWALDIAFEYPEIHVMGFDISKRMTDYANLQARAQGLENASFRVMNALEPLDFADNTFDLVNSRLIVSFMPRTVWPNLVRECVRITKSGGIVRLTEVDNVCETNSPACERINGLVTQAMYLRGLGFSEDGKSVHITPMLKPLLQEAGCINIQQTPYVIDFSVGTEVYEGYRQNFLMVYELVKPLLLKMNLLTSDKFDQLLQQATVETLLDSFKGTWTFLSAWGYKP